MKPIISVGQYDLTIINFKTVNPLPAKIAKDFAPFPPSTYTLYTSFHLSFLKLTPLTPSLLRKEGAIH
jgi:hypothetical protein